jgi:type III restriction enzyme
MKFTLKDYQEEAVRDVLVNLRKARKRWSEDKDKHAFSLTAATGAGKTVMAAAVLEALFHGDDNYEFDADPGAVVIWFSDDPSLNEQTRFRLMEASDRLQHSDLVVVENTFNRARLDPGKIYFLNTQKLGKNSLLVRGFDGDDEGEFPEMRPDLRSHTIWDTIRNTIDDPDLTLYLVLDEAHRGMGKPTAAVQNEKSTIVRRLINGERGVPGIPVVLGISATVDRFNKAMEGSKDRTTLPNVEVDPVRVQDSGLLKDTIVLDVPDEVGKFDTVLVRRATDKLRELSEEWASYAKEQDDGDAVLPLMVLQVPNTPNPNDIGRALDTIFQQWSGLEPGNVAHVLGEHTTQTFGNYSVPHISPERVQDAKWVRILIAKDAISTGWDCPRAEVMVSFRRATDHTHIMQLLGRMVRTPLARRIPGNDRLNSVDCLLPFFDEKTVNAVVQSLTQGGGDSLPAKRVLINPSDMLPNPAATDAIWEKFTSLPSQTRPQRGAKPPVRLTMLAQALVDDELLEDAGQKAHAAMHKFLDAMVADNSYAFDEKRKAVLTVEGRTVVADLVAANTKSKTFQAEADVVVVDDAYRRAARILSPDIARTYTELRAKRNPDAEDDFEAALLEAREDIAAIGLLENLQLAYDAEAMKASDAWLAKYKDKVKKLTDDRQEVYRSISAFSREPQDVDLAQPKSWLEATAIRDASGKESAIPTHEHHLLCDDQGHFPANLNGWETTILKTETQRPGFKFWYRNPKLPGQDSLGIAYKDGDEVKIVRPDFLFFSVDKNKKVVVDIVDPHGTHLSDSLPRLKGMAAYAMKHSQDFRRVEVIAELKGKMRVLDLTDAAVRDGIMSARNAKELFEGPLAKDYC